MRINGNRRKKTDRSLTILCPKQKNTEYTLVKISKVYIPSIYIIDDVKNNNFISKMIPYFKLIAVHSLVREHGDAGVGPFSR